MEAMKAGALDWKKWSVSALSLAIACFLLRTLSDVIGGYLLDTSTGVRQGAEALLMFVAVLIYFASHLGMSVCLVWAQWSLVQGVRNRRWLEAAGGLMALLLCLWYWFANLLYKGMWLASH